jgi:CRISPR-associated protein Csc2
MTSEIGRKIMEYIGEEFFTTDEKEKIPALCQNNPKNVTLLVIRETIAPFINRSNSPDESVTFTMPDERRVIHVPARKFKSKEKIFGIKMLRYLGMIDSGYRYNELTLNTQMRNATSILMGDGVVKKSSEQKEDGIFVPARALYSDVYSIRDSEYITDKLTNNALNEMGTMYSRETGTTRSSFFFTEFVVPGVFFPALITLKDPTPELLLHLFVSLRGTAYGASTAITGPNFRNHVIGIVGSRVEPPVTSYSVSLKHPPDNPSTINFDWLKGMILGDVSSSGTDGMKIVPEENVKALVDYVKSLDRQSLMEAYRVLNNDIEAFFTYSYPGKKAGSKKSKGSKTKENNEPKMPEGDDSGNISS